MTQKYVLKNGALQQVKNGLFHNASNLVFSGKVDTPAQTNTVLNTGQSQIRPDGLQLGGRIETATTDVSDIQHQSKPKQVLNANKKLLIYGGIGVVVFAGIIYLATRKKSA